jgi:hypothetical protein
MSFNAFYPTRRQLCEREPIGIKVKDVIRSVQVSVHHEPDRDKITVIVALKFSSE